MVWPKTGEQMSNYSGVIYGATNILNGKMYIGLTNNYNKRKWKHKSLSFNLKQNSLRIHRSISKYGWENFVWEVLITLKSNTKETLYKKLKFWERKFINMYDTYNAGYNDTAGGDGSAGYRHSLPSKIKIREARSRQNIICSDETKRKISESLVGHTVSLETRKKLSVALTGRKIPNNVRRKISKNCSMRNKECVKKIVMANSKLWVVVRPDGHKEIVKNLKNYCIQNKLNSGHMSEVASGKRSHHKGYIVSRLQDN